MHKDRFPSPLSPLTDMIGSAGGVMRDFSTRLSRKVIDSAKEKLGQAQAKSGLIRSSRASREWLTLVPAA